MGRLFSLMDLALRKESKKLGKINSTSASTGKEMEEFFFPRIFPRKNKQIPVFPHFLMVQL